MQCQRCPAQGSSSVHLSAMETAKKLIQKEGSLRLFRGISAMFGACIPAHAAYFSVFENMKHILQANGPGHTPLAAGLAGVAATISHDLIMTPMDVRKKQEMLNIQY